MYAGESKLYSGVIVTLSKRQTISSEINLHLNKNSLIFSSICKTLEILMTRDSYLFDFIGGSKIFKILSVPVLSYSLSGNCFIILLMTFRSSGC